MNCPSVGIVSTHHGVVIAHVYTQDQVTRVKETERTDVLRRECYSLREQLGRLKKQVSIMCRACMHAWWILEYFVTPLLCSTVHECREKVVSYLLILGLRHYTDFN